jgi:hypothetical protein
MKYIIMIVAIFQTQLDGLFNPDWAIDETRVIYGNKITRLSGVCEGVCTNIGYESIRQIEHNLEEKAEEEMWTSDKKIKTIDAFKHLSPGGTVRLYVTRSDLDLARGSTFSVIVQDSVGNEVSRQDIAEKIPSTPGASGLWSNILTARITNTVSTPFYVYVIDKYGGDNKRHKFKIH